MMRFIVIILLSLCHFVTKANDHIGDGNKVRQDSYVNYDGNKHDTYLHTGNLNAQNEFILDIDDDDDRRIASPVITSIVQLYLQPYLDFYQSICKNQHSCFETIIIPTNRYITQRVLRI